MSIKKHKVGDVVSASIRTWTIGKSKLKQTPYVRVSFNGYITWTGYLTAKTTESTMKSLETMGFSGANLSQLRNDNALNTSKSFNCVIDEVREHEGRIYYNASWVNDPSKQSSGFSDKDVDEDVMKEFENFDTRAYIDNAKDIDPPAASESYSLAEDQNFTADDIPF